MIDRILFVTSTNLATNPRCVKEIQLAVQEGIEVNVIACKLNGWSQVNEKIIQQTLGDKVEISYVDVTRMDKFKWVISSLIEKLSTILFRYFNSHRLSIVSFALSKRSYSLLRRLNKTSWIPSLVIAHNPAAFYPAYQFAKSNNSMFAIDVEDYHPGERQPLLKMNLVKLLMQKLLPEANYTSYASPLILRQCIQEMAGIEGRYSHVINNVFWQKEFSLPGPITDEPLKLVWFSQNVDYNRGLENLLKALDKLNGSFTLTLIGNVRKEFLTNELKCRSYIKILDPLPQPELHRLLASYDVGLAVENAGTDVNRAICLTNKIWTYFQSGLYIMASRTQAQAEFIHQFPEHGFLVDHHEDSFLKAFLYLMQNRVHINSLRLERFNKAIDFSWDTESKKLLKVWQELPGTSVQSKVLTNLNLSKISIQ